MTKNLELPVLDQQDGDRRIEHNGGVDGALLYCSDGGGAEADADHSDRVRIHAVLAQHVFEEEVRRRSRRAYADFLVSEVLDRIDLRGVLGRNDQCEARIAIIDHEGLQVLALGCEIHAVVKITRHDVSTAPMTALSDSEPPLKSTISTLTPAFSYSPSACASMVGR